MTEITGLIYDIQRLALHDGPGTRTTVFLKGCPLRCDWCHNPESQSVRPVLAQFKHNCLGCGHCLTACSHQALSRGDEGLQINRTLCQGCGACVAVCPAEALVLHGQQMTVTEVMAEVEKDRLLYENSGGGLTLSGGEPLAQPKFTLALLKAARAAGLHTCLDTCGYAPWATLEQMLPWVDIILYDLKGVDPAKHRTRTGRSNHLILQNLRSLNQEGVQVMLRSPLVPDLNDSEEAMRALADFVLDLQPVPQLEIMPYQQLEEGKYEALGLGGGRQIVPPEPEKVAALAGLLREMGLDCLVAS
jgi:pyruvate formate lyase activating enzyme